MKCLVPLISCENGGLDLTLSWSELSLGDMIGDNGMGS